jgi:hypothetical protein
MRPPKHSAPKALELLRWKENTVMALLEEGSISLPWSEMPSLLTSTTHSRLHVACPYPNTRSTSHLTHHPSDYPSDCRHVLPTPCVYGHVFEWPKDEGAQAADW